MLHKGKVKSVTVTLALPSRLIPVKGGRPPSYFIFAGLVFLQATVPFLRSEYGKEFDFEAPVKLLVRSDELLLYQGKCLISILTASQSLILWAVFGPPLLSRQNHAESLLLGLLI